MPKRKITSPSMFIGVQNGDFISFGSGQPDLPPPQQVLIAPHQRPLFQYGLIQGELPLRVALTAEYPGSTPENFLITNGASEALDLLFRAIHLKHGPSQVLMCRPYYYSYPELVRLSGHEPIYTDLVDGRIDVKDVERKLAGAKAVIINSPSNPTGRVEDLETLRRIEQLTANRGIYLISDEVYKDLIYERENYQLHGPHVATVNSFSKTYSLCGVRVGYLYTTDADLIAAAIEMKTHTSMNTSLVGQDMALVALQAPKSFIHDRVKIYDERRNFIYSGLVELGFDLWKPEGAFYVLPKIKHSDQVVTDLYYQHKVIVYDGAWFGAPGRIRLSYALDIDKIRAGLDRIKDYLADKRDWLVPG